MGYGPSGFSSVRAFTFFKRGGLGAPPQSLSYAAHVAHESNRKPQKNSQPVTTRVTSCTTEPLKRSGTARWVDGMGRSGCAPIPDPPTTSPMGNHPNSCLFESDYRGLKSKSTSK